MQNQQITVFYKWTAKPGKLEELRKIYTDVLEEVNKNEPGTLKMQCYFSEEENALLVHDLFADAGALGAHLGGTAAKHFPGLTEIAVPGPFMFCGDVPDEIKAAANGMNMGAIFATHSFGYDRA